jgi:peptide/nickel transport system substrate-binding protein
MSPQPALAASWTWSLDFRQLRLALRPGVQFHSGRPFTSQDARSNLERVRDPAVASQWRNYAELMHIDTPDAGTLVINFDAPLKSSMDAVALTFMADPSSLDQKDQGRSYVGTGPFRFKEWMPGDHLAVERNPDYWQRGKPYLDSVELRVLTDPASAVVALEANALDWLTGVPGQDARRLRNDSAYRVLLNGNGGVYYFVGFDVSHPDLADRRVRQAFGFALNRPRIVEVALNGFGRPTCVAWPPQSLGYDATQDQTYVYDLERARALLRDAGWDSTHVVPLLVPDFVPLARRVADILQSDLERIGMQVSVQLLSGAELAARGQRRQYGGAWISPMSFSNLNPTTFLITSSVVRVPNASNFVTPRYKQLIDQAVNLADDRALKATVHEVTQIMLDEAFILPFAEGAGQLAGPEVVRARVNDTHWDGVGWFSYQDVWLSQ